MTKAFTAEKAHREPVPMNGVDTPTLLATINAVGGQPELARFRFRARNRWVSGTRSRTTIDSFFGAGGEHQHRQPTEAEGDHPTVLVGTDTAPTPVEWVLHALSSCITAGIGNIAAARGIALSRVESRIEGNIDLRGILGLSKEVRNGFENIAMTFEIEGDAPAEDLERIVLQSKARSAVFDIVTKGVPVEIAVVASRAA